jgi:stage III sporulation protein SpoIIIAA
VVIMVLLLFAEELLEFVLFVHGVGVIGTAHGNALTHLICRIDSIN